MLKPELWQQPWSGVTLTLDNVHLVHSNPLIFSHLFPVHGSYGHSLYLCSYDYVRLRGVATTKSSGDGGLVPVSMSG